MNAARGTDGRSLERVRRKVLGMPGVSRVRRPTTPGGDGTFDLHYVRGGPGGTVPVLVLPGGPGLASVLPYHAFRTDAIRHGLDVLMVEHRGIGLSRRADDGADLPPEAITVPQVVDDLAAVLDACGVRRAVVYGSSYGAFLAQMFGARHPDRVAGMVLDSGGSLNPDDGLLVREELRNLLWEGNDPRTAAVARKLRELAGDGLVPPLQSGTVIPPVYEFGGVDLLDRFYDQVRAGRASRTWRWLADLARTEVAGTGQPFVLEPDLVGPLGFREVGRQPEPDGQPLDSGAVFSESLDDRPAFEGWAHDLRAATASFDWPCAVMSGERDLRAPRGLARRVADLAPDGVLVPLSDTGHSALDTHRLAGLHVAHAVAAGTHQRLLGLADRIAALRRRGLSGRLGTLIAARLAGERVLPPIDRF